MPTNSPQDVQPLNIMTFPLHGSRLIEASAGTGKTYTIAGLYLRLLLGHGDDQARHHQPLTVDQILVVTFTEAATEELRDRIRKRIHEARLAFLRGKTEDDFLNPFLEQTPNREAAAQLLLNAERQMDEAAIFTIHGFCQRMLKQHAFESGAQFNNELITDEAYIKAQVVADYWRKNFYSLPIDLVQEIKKLWESPKKLFEEVGRYLSGAELSLTTAPPKSALLDIHENNISRIQNIKQRWIESSQDLHDLIMSSGVDKRSYKSNTVPKWLDEVTSWAESETKSYSVPKNLSRFSQRLLHEKTKKGEVPVHTIFDEVDEFLAEEISLKGPLLAQVIQQCRARLKQVKEQKQVFSFDDLLTQLSAAIDIDDTATLTEKIRQQYPVAMIDEFQDTDPLQYSIFSQIYLSDPQSALLMIGDPKQAIYGFRGADIFTYIKAKQQVTSQYTLDTNWRSGSQMVEAVNQLFSTADSPFFYDEEIPFLPVKSSPGSELKTWSLSIGQEELTQPAFNVWLSQQGDSFTSIGDYQATMAQATASQIYTILSAAQEQKAHLTKNSGKKVIQASDIAILVRNRSQAQLIKQALLDRGIASVYLSNRQSVFLSSVARDLLNVLNAVLAPENERYLKACLASSLFDLPISTLDRLNNDENAWEAAIFEFKEYRNIWHQKGLLPMLRSLMSKRQVAEHLLSREGGDRILTDLMHLGELLQQASLEIDSFFGLIHWLSQKIDDASGASNSEEHNQRLESESNLVQIVTIHKSKGLEYNLVFLPFACSYSQAREAKYHDPSSETTVLDVEQSAEALEKAEKERIAEDLRLIYVALTRSVYGCFVGISPIKKGNAKKQTSDLHQSAIGHLIQNGVEGDASVLQQSIKSLCEATSSIAIADLPIAGEAKLAPTIEENLDIQAQDSRRDIERNWRLTSYSGLVKHSAHGQQKELIVDEASFDIDSEEEQELESATTAFEYSIFSFPKGARPGTFLHTLFEQVDFNLPADSDENQQIIMKLLERENYDLLWSPVLSELVDNVLQAKLNQGEVCLADIPATSRLVEMEFLLPIQMLTASQLNTIVHKYDQISKLAGELGFHPVKGMLKGFIDLVFECQGKFYVLDWKSNYLGDSIEDYHSQALQEAMADHRYDLQYQIYSLALHRYLKTRIADYNYDQHFGGVYYVFLRGVAKEQESGIFYQKPDYALINEMDELIDGKTSLSSGTESGQMELGL